MELIKRKDTLNLGTNASLVLDAITILDKLEKLTTFNMGDGDYKAEIRDFLGDSPLDLWHNCGFTVANGETVESTVKKAIEQGIIDKKDEKSFKEYLENE